MENASAAFLEAVCRSMRAVRQVLGSTGIDRALLTSAKRIHYDGFQRRQDSSQVIAPNAAHAAADAPSARSTTPIIHPPSVGVR
jgi:hypothetical protein